MSDIVCLWIAVAFGAAHAIAINQPASVETLHAENLPICRKRRVPVLVIQVDVNKCQGSCISRARVTSPRFVPICFPSSFQSPSRLCFMISPAFDFA